MNKQDYLKKIRTLKLRSLSFLTMAVVGFISITVQQFRLVEKEKQAMKAEEEALAYKENYAQARDSLTTAKARFDTLLQKLEANQNNNVRPIISELKREVEQSRYAGYLVYIQQTDSVSANLAGQLRKALKQESFNVPEIEQKVGDYVNEVRYFYKQDRGAAETVKDFLENTFTSNKLDGNVLLRDKPISLDKMPPLGQIEVWINTDKSSPINSPSANGLIIIAGTYRDKTKAEAMVGKLKKIGFEAEIYEKRSSWRVVVGPFDSYSRFNIALAKVRSQFNQTAYSATLEHWCKVTEVGSKVCID